MALSPSERTLRARLAAHTLHAQGGTNTGPAREALLAKFENEVDPDRVLDPVTRATRAEHARKAHYTRLAMKSVAARRKAPGAA